MLYSVDVFLPFLGKFQSSPALTGGCYLTSMAGCGILILVSILTRPYGRMLCVQLPPAGGAAAVSILTRPYGRMLFLPSSMAPRAHRFQSSPALTGGCYDISGRGISSLKPGFNPHPPLRADAISSSDPPHHGGECFNPHPPLRADAIFPALPRGHGQ